MGVPGIAAQLVGGVNIVLYVDRRFLGFHEELALGSHLEGVIRRFGGALDFEGILDQHIGVLRGDAFLVVHVPTEGGEELVEELLAQARFVVFAGAVGGAVLFKFGDELVDDLRRGHGQLPLVNRRRRLILYTGMEKRA